MDDQLHNGNGHGRVKFDRDHPHKTLSAEDAEALLCLVFDRHRATFGALLGEVVTGERFTKARERKRTPA